MVLGAQTYFQFHKVKMDTATLAVVSVSMCSELGPVLTALMVAGRVGAAIAAEIGTMRVTEQIDALRTLATHPVDYLIVPRLIAAQIALPLLTLESIVVGIGASYLVDVHILGIEPTYLWVNMLHFTHDVDLAMGLIKSFIYGGIIALIGCYKGMTCGLGAEGVGRATTEAVVYSSITILITNFFLTMADGQTRGAIMIEARNLEKSFGAQKVLDDVSFRIENGESVAIIGRSGGGKSVLLKHLIGLLKPDSGEVLIDGENIEPMNERQLLRVRRKFGMVFQGAALFDSMTVAENVAFGLRRHEHLTEAEIARRVAQALEMVDLPGTENKNPAELSGGMRKRVGLARAIIYEPQIVLYDEPTTGLDPIVSDSIDKLMIRVRDHLKVTSIVVTHDMRTRAARGQSCADAAR